MPTHLQQIAGYVPSNVKDELIDMTEHDRKLSLSILVSEAIDIAMPKLRERYGVFPQPVQVAHGRKTKTA